jgi:hypothetical protein
LFKVLWIRDVRAYYAKTKNITQHTFALDLSISLKDQLVKYPALFIISNNITGTCDFTEDNIWANRGRLRRCG